MLAVGCMVSAEAADHPCMKREIPTTRDDQSYRCLDNDIHEVKYYVEYECQTCGRAMGNTNNATRTEGHNRDRYRDLGHQNDTTHKYEIYCGNCGGGAQEIYLNTCNGHITGHHTTPW